jgi:mannosyltransferase
MSVKKQKKIIHIGDNLDDGRQIKTQSDSRYIQLLIMLTISAFVLRFYNLGFNSLWLDEASTNLIALKSFGDIWQTMLGVEFNPPLFYWMEHILISLLGNSEFILRLLPALFGVAVIPVIYLVGTEFRNRNVGIITAAAFTFSPFLILYSQEARSYSMMLFFTACAMLFYFKALKSNDIKNWVVFGAFSALAFWSHFYAFVMIVSCLIYAMMVHIKEIKKDINYVKPFILSLITFIGLSLPLIIVTIDLFGKRTSTAPTYGLQGMNVIVDTFNQVSGYSELITALFVILFIIGIFQAFIVDKTRATFLVWSIISIFVVSYFLSYKIPMIPRYLQFFVIIFFMGIAMSYKLLFNLKPSKNIIYCMVLLFMVISVPFYIPYYSQETKVDWRGFSKGLSTMTKPGDYVVFVPGYLQTPTEYYYSNKTNGVMYISAYVVSDLDKIQKNNNSVFYVMTGDALATDPSGGTMNWLSKNTRLITNYKGIYLSVR